jgi:hypothetical protein
LFVPKVGPWLRVSLPIAIALLIAVWWTSIVWRDDRAISEKEFLLAAGALAVSSQPMLISELIRAAIKRID